MGEPSEEELRALADKAIESFAWWEDDASEPVRERAALGRAYLTVLDERARDKAEIARLRAALESIDAGMPNYEARGMGDPVPADFAVPPSAANAIRRVIRDALNPPATEAKP